MYYDDAFVRNFGQRAKRRVKAIMAEASRTYTEKGLGTFIDVNTVAIEHVPGDDWGSRKWRYNGNP